MEVVQKAVSEAVHAVRNSPLLRRRFGDRENSRDDPDEEPLSPEKDRTPFVQGFTYRVDYLGKAVVDPGQEQDHGCTDHAVELLWTNNDDVNRPVSIRVTTNNVRVKLTEDSSVLYDFPVLRITYCGLDKHHKEAISFVARETEGRFCCYVFRAASKDKAYAMALSITKAFYLACQILQEEQGLFPPTPDREKLFEPQRDDDTKESPSRPMIPGSPPTYRIQTQQNQLQDTSEDEPNKGPTVRVTRPSLASNDSLSSSIDDDFVRLAKARSNPDILRSTVGVEAITHPSLDYLRQHADTPLGTPTGSCENLLP